MPYDGAGRPSDDQVCDAMRVMADAIGVLRFSRPYPDDLARLLAAMATIPEAIQRNHLVPFSSYQLGIAIEDAKQIMRETERRAPPRRPSWLGFLKPRRALPRCRILPGGPPVSRLGTLIARLRYGRTTGTARTDLTLSPPRSGKGSAARVFPSLIESARRDDDDRFD